MALLDSDIAGIILLSLYVSGTAAALSAVIGVPLGTFLGTRGFFGERAIRTLIYTLYGFPPIVAGVLMYLLFSRMGPFGAFDLLYTPGLMILTQVLLILPVITGLTIAATAEVDRALKDTALSLGASSRQLRATVLREARPGVLAAIMVGLGQGLSEVGAVFIVGGNIEGRTQTMTTAILQAVRNGEFDFAVALAGLLFLIALAIYAGLEWIQRREFE